MSTPLEERVYELTSKLREAERQRDELAVKLTDARAELNLLNWIRNYPGRTAA
jgi:hypothetical protein